VLTLQRAVKREHCVPQRANRCENVLTGLLNVLINLNYVLMHFDKVREDEKNVYGQRTDKFE
jgi:hypothetical protein